MREIAVMFFVVLLAGAFSVVGGRPCLWVILGRQPLVGLCGSALEQNNSKTAV